MTLCKRASILVSTLTLIACFVSCAAGTHGTQRMYSGENGKRLAVSEVARVLMHDMIGFGNSLEVSLDSLDPINVRDTLEMRPGRHVMQIRVHYNSDLKSAAWKGTPPGKGEQACLYFDFVAEAGHQYSFILMEFKLSDWQVDLVDNTSPSQIVHGVHCPKPEHYWPKP